MQPVAALEGVRYELSRLERLFSVLAPPYDVVSLEKAREYVARSPYNVLRLDLGLRDGDGGLVPGDWEHAGRLFRRWLEEGVLRAERSPSVYVMRHQYQAPDGSRGVLTVAFVGLRAGGGPQRAALPHERTLQEVCNERLRQLQVCRAHFSPILAVVNDPSGAVREALEQACSGPAQASDESPLGGDVELWVYAAAEPVGRRLMDALAASLSEHPAVIADGHHRFEAASRLAQTDGQPAAQYVLAGLTPMEQGGLAVLPIHRLVGPATAQMRERLRLRLYEYLMPVASAELPRSLQSELPAAASDVRRAAELVRAMRAALGRTVVGVWWGPGQVEFLAEPAKAAWRARNARPELPGAASDVVLLHRGPLADWELLADPPSGPGSSQPAGGWVAFSPVATEAARVVEEGRAAAAILVSPVTLADVREVAVAGKRMPQKSTYFYPKLTSGLVLADLERGVLPWPAGPGAREEG